jgi:hypothetical protein
MAEFRQNASGEEVIKVCRVEMAGEGYQSLPFEEVARPRDDASAGSLRENESRIEFRAGSRALAFS